MKFEKKLLVFYDDLRRMAHTYFKRRPEDAEDLLQETMRTALESKHQFKEGTNLRAWLYNIMRTRAYNRYKIEGRKPRMTSLENPKLDKKTFSEWKPVLPMGVYDNLEKVNPIFRESLLLHLLEGYSYKEIAAILDIPVGTVMSRIKRARRQFKASYEKNKDN